MCSCTPSKAGGKTTLAAHAPDPLILMAPGEDGYMTLLDQGRVPEVARVEIESWQETLGVLDHVIAQPDDYRTVVLDGLAGFESLCHQKVCSEHYNGEWGEKGFAAYGRGYDVATREWVILLERLDRLRQLGKTILLLAHYEIRAFANPTGPDFDTYLPNLHKKTWQVTKPWPDHGPFRLHRHSGCEGEGQSAEGDRWRGPCALHQPDGRLRRKEPAMASPPRSSCRRTPLSSGRPSGVRWREDIMRLEYEGRFLADITDYGIFQARNSQAVAIDIWFTTVSYFGPKGEAPYDGYQTRGRFFIIGRSGDALPEQVTALSEAFEWDGDLNPIRTKTWEPRQVQIVVKKETNTKDGREYFNVAWVQRPDWEPAQAGNVNDSTGREIASRYTTTLQSLIRKHRRQKGEQPAEPRKPKKPEAAMPADPEADLDMPVKRFGEMVWDEKKAWEVFRYNCGDMDSKARLQVWEEAIHHFGGGKPKEELTADEWDRISDIDPRSWTPF